MGGAGWGMFLSHIAPPGGTPHTLHLLHVLDAMTLISWGKLSPGDLGGDERNVVRGMCETRHMTSHAPPSACAV